MRAAVCSTGGRRCTVAAAAMRTRDPNRGRNHRHYHCHTTNIHEELSRDPCWRHRPIQHPTIYLTIGRVLPFATLTIFSEYVLYIVLYYFNGYEKFSWPQTFYISSTLNIKSKLCLFNIKAKRTLSMQIRQLNYSVLYSDLSL